VDKKEIYKWIKLGGLLSFIPFIMAAGPLLGYWVGDYLVKEWNSPFVVLILSLLVGLLVSLRESIRIIRLALKFDKHSKELMTKP